MVIILNGVKTTVARHTSLAQLIESVHERDPQLIVEHNYRFVFPQFYATTFLSEGDTVELINPDFGG